MDEDYSIELALIRSVTRRPTEESPYSMCWLNGKRSVVVGWRSGEGWDLSTCNRNAWIGYGHRRFRFLPFDKLYEHLTNPRFAKYWRIAPK